MELHGLIWEEVPALLRDNYITLYNIYRNKDGENETFNRTILFVHLEENTGKRDDKTSEASTSTLTLFVPFHSQNECKKSYVEPEVYMKLSDHSQIFTFKKGDIVVKGQLKEDITSEKEFILRHPEALRIKKCDTNNFGGPAMRHWEVCCD